MHKIILKFKLKLHYSIFNKIKKIRYESNWTIDKLNKILSIRSLLQYKSNNNNDIVIINFVTNFIEKLKLLEKNQ